MSSAPFDACTIVHVASTEVAPARFACGNPMCVSTEAGAEQRARDLIVALKLESARARRWRLAWAGINGLSTVAPLAAMPFVRRTLWPDLVAGSISSALSTGFTFFWPLQVEGVAGELDAMAGLEPCERLFAVQMFAAAASENEVARRAWPWHVVNFGLSAALGAALAYGFDHPTAGWVTGLSGFVVGEAQLFTQPSSLRDLRLSLVVAPPVSSAPGPRAFALVAATVEAPLP